MQEHHRLVRQCGKPGVDVGDGVWDTPCQLVGFCSLEGDLDEDDLGV